MYIFLVFLNFIYLIIISPTGSPPIFLVTGNPAIVGILKAPIAYPIKANNATTTLTYAGRIIHYVNSSGSYQQYPQGTSSGYGVYGYAISSSGSLIIRSRYSSSYSLTINGTFNAKVYTLDYTADSGGNPFSFSF